MTLASNILECYMASISYNIYKKKEKAGIIELEKINESLQCTF